MSNDKKRWIVKRHVVEHYEAYGDTRDDAIDYTNTHGNPFKVVTKKETAVQTKS